VRHRKKLVVMKTEVKNAYIPLSIDSFPVF
jgi:hypothetical protein